MKKYHWISSDLQKEENWINEQIKKGFRLKSINTLTCIHRFTPCEYSAEELENNIGTVRIDFRNFSKKDDFNEYKTIFEDSGWKLLFRSFEGYSFFEKVKADATDDIFSDSSSRAECYKRITNYLIPIILAYIPIFTLYSDQFNIDKMLHPKQCFYTPGLWEMTGAGFAGAFLFELPFALFRAYSGLIYILCALIILLVFFRHYRLYRKYQKTYHKQ